MSFFNNSDNPTYYYDDYYDDYNISSTESLCLFSTSYSVSLVVGPYIHAIICILGLVGNGLVILTYAFYKRTKSMTDVYLLNVAIADLLFVLALPFIIYNELYSWPMGQVACKLLRGSYSVNLYSGMLMLACISTDRYIAIVQARRSFRLRSLSYSRVICVLIWLCAVLVSVPTFYFYHWYEPTHSIYIGFDEEEKTPTAPQYVCEIKFHNTGTARIWKIGVPIIQLSIGFFLPLLIMIFCYASVMVTLLKNRNFQQHKAVRVVLVVVLVFILCHLPYNLVLLFDTISLFDQIDCHVADSLQTAITLLQTLAYMHCCLNPVLYAVFRVKFRNRHFSSDTSNTYISHVATLVDDSNKGASITM
ncbi:C-C chemokine receptor type 6 [Fundulus heteroclitus]|uniref:C-C chemokine receptor type 6 n=1 Tax=Fundulus heteroclitus TaxID=8078 RepID=UPI00165A7F73|nr:C-C chemokine receptor type 6 [Fundulus heteroclitus]